eukprot:scaffold1108_cov260-Pinguiococcus_pyrenoidosus.AAC.4
MSKKYPGGMPDVERALTAELERLGDPYTRFLTPDKYNSIYASATGEIAGIGVSLAKENGAVLFVDVEPGAPADKAGVKPGARLLAVDGAEILLPGQQPTTPQARTKVVEELDEVAGLLRGQPGSGLSVKVCLERLLNAMEGEERRWLIPLCAAPRASQLDQDGKVEELKLSRQAIKISSVRAGQPARFTVNGKKIGNLRPGNRDLPSSPPSWKFSTRIKSFSGETATQVQNLLNSPDYRNVDILLLDLRSNGGGLITGRKTRPSRTQRSGVSLV